MIKNVVLQRKGHQYTDTDTGTIHFLYNSMVIVADYKPEEHRWAVITVYRDPDAEAKRRGSLPEVDVDKAVSEPAN